MPGADLLFRLRGFRLELGEQIIPKRRHADRALPYVPSGTRGGIQGIEGLPSFFCPRFPGKKAMQSMRSI